MLLRDNTDDLETFCQVFGGNEYHLPKDLKEATVIDVGAHVGSFAMLALARDAGKVVCFEPDSRNYTVLSLNMYPYRDRVITHNLAVWRSDGQGDLPRMVFRECPTCSHCFAPDTAPVTPFVTLDDVLARHPEATWLKLDCEGAEYGILATSKRLGQIRRIVGEMHPMLGNAAATVGVKPTRDAIHGLLTVNGFTKIEFEPNKDNFLFFAERTS